MRDKVAIVTGGAGGIGRATAELFAENGSIVVIVDYDADNARQLESELRTNGKIASAFTADVSCKREVEEVVCECMRTFGRIDALVNCAGIAQVVPLMDITEEQWDQVMAVNLKSVLFFSQAVVPHMLDASKGTIVNVASIAGKQGGLLTGAHYSVSKAGIICLTKCLARELASSGIRVNAVCPAITDTGMGGLFTEEQIAEVVKGIPLGRMARAEEIAQATLFLSAEASSYITGEIVDVNGGSLMD